MSFIIPTLFISSINQSIDQAITEHYQKPLSFIIHITHIPSPVPRSPFPVPRSPFPVPRSPFPVPPSTFSLPSEYP